MELDQNQQEVAAALAHSASYEESVSILAGLHFDRRDAAAIAAAHHGLAHGDLRDETPPAAA